MDADPTVLIGVGGLLVILNLILGIVELATLRTIRPPEQKSFTYLLLAANQYQNIVVPALGHSYLVYLSACLPPFFMRA